MNAARQSRNQIVLVLVLVLGSAQRIEDEDEKFAQEDKTFRDGKTRRKTVVIPVWYRFISSENSRFESLKG
jgi:hypothetical protein